MSIKYNACLWFECRILNFTEQVLTIKNSILPEYISDFLQSSRFYLQVGMFSMMADKLESDGVNILIQPLEVEEKGQIRAE